MAATANKLRVMGLATRTRLADRTRSVQARARSINANLRRRNDEKLAAVRRINGELVGIAERVARQAEAVLRNARRGLRRQGDQATGRARATVERLAQLIERTRRVAAQTRHRLAGTTPEGATRLVSLHDPDARPIAKGRLGKPVEFGYKAQLVDNDDGVIVDHNVEAGNPPDAPMLTPAIARIKQRTGRAPRAVTADRGYGEAAVEDALHAVGVRYVVLPRKGRPNTSRRHIENRRAFRKMIRWRTGCEGRISCAKRDYGLARTRIDGLAGARTWCGHGVFNHNLVKISKLIT
jgi:IS5 family transposase